MKSNLIERVGQILRAVSSAVVMPRFTKLLSNETEMKGAGDPVTIADRQAELVIGAELLELIPNSRVIGEEACSVNPALLKNLDDGVVWVVDPIDGTANFAAGRAPFAMMVAMLRDGETIGAWILDPLSDRLVVAELGGGAWIGGKRLSTRASPSEPHKWHGIVSRAFLPETHQVMVDALSSTIGLIDPTARCAGHEYPLVAAGVRDFALYWRTLVWDHAPGALVLSEAGGRVMHLDGTIYSPCIARTGLLLAHDPDVAATFRAMTACRAASDL